jgi:hypothetical protein
MIITNRLVCWKSPRPAQPSGIITARVIQRIPRRQRDPTPLASDADANARVEAFFKRMNIIPPSASDPSG